MAGGPGIVSEPTYPMPSLLHDPADTVPTVVIDLETTGLSVEEGHRVIEVAAIRVDEHGKQVLETLIDPGRAIPIEGQRIHHITDAMVAEQPPFSDVLPLVREMVEDAVFVAHNAPTDLAFLHAECARLGEADLAPAAVVDTLSLARTVFGLQHCSLSALAERIGAQHHPQHRALGDAEATLAVYHAMLKALNPERVPSVSQLHALRRSLARGGDGRKEIRKALRDAHAQGRSVVIDYTSGAGGALTTRRRITITRLRPTVVEAQCHLRQQPRVFKLSRIRRVVDPEPLD